MQKFVLLAIPDVYSTHHLISKENYFRIILQKVYCFKVVKALMLLVIAFCEFYPEINAFRYKHKMSNTAVIYLCTCTFLPVFLGTPIN